MLLTMPNEYYFKRACYLALVILSLIALIGAALIFRGGLHIDTNLKNLAPPFLQDEVVSHAIDKMSNSASQQFRLVIAHADANQVEAASEFFREEIEARSTLIKYLDSSAIAKDYAAFLTKNRFKVLHPQTQELLATQTDQQILSAAKANLYGGGGALRLIALADDPLGFVNEYALGVLEKLPAGAGDDVQEIVLEGNTVFASVHLLQLSTNALEMRQQENALKAIDDIKKSVLEKVPNVQFLQSGMIFFAADSAQRAKKDINLIGIGSTIGVVLLFLLVFRNVKSLIIPVVATVLGPLFALCVCHLLFGSLHIITLVFGASLIGVVGDYSLHFYYFYNKKKSSENIMLLYRALLLSLITSVIGYGALSLSGLGALRQVAVFSGLGLIYSWLVVISLGSALIQQNRMNVHDRYLQRVVSIILTCLEKIRYRLCVFGALVILTGLLFFIGFSFPTNDSPKAFFSLNPSLVQQEKILSELTASYEPASFIVVNANNAQQLYDRIASLETALGPDAKALFGVRQLFPSPEQQQKNYHLNARLYGENGLVEQFLQQHKMTSIDAKNINAKSIAEDYLKNKNQLLSQREFFSRNDLLLPPFWVESGSTIYSFMLIPKTINTNTLAVRLHNIEGVKYVSAIADVETSLKQLRFSALELLGVALILIALLAFTQYELLLTIKIIVVPLCSIAMTFVGLAALGIPLTIFHIMALFLVLGLSMDYVIFAAEMAENSVETLTAIVLAAITSLLSFGLLVFSSLPAVSAFGITVIIGSAFNLFGALVLASQKMKDYNDQNNY
jgi:predicted exporter